MARLLKYYDHIQNAPPEDSVLNFMLENYFLYKHFKNTTQRNATSEIVKRVSDVIVSLPKGCGRTMCFQLPMLICLQKVSIVFVGLSSRIKEQTNRLTRANIYVEILSAKMSVEDWTRINNNLFTLCSMLSTQNSILYANLDLLSDDNFLSLVNRLVENNNLGYIVVDEAYCENDWILGRKEEYNALSILRSIYSHIPWVVTTAQTSAEVINCIKTKLSLRTFGPDFSENSIPWFGLNLFYDEVLADR